MICRLKKRGFTKIEKMFRAEMRTSSLEVS
jgi:hypothetical protein